MFMAMLKECYSGRKEFEDIRKIKLVSRRKAFKDKNEKSYRKCCKELYEEEGTVMM